MFYFVASDMSMIFKQRERQNADKCAGVFCKQEKERKN